MPQPSERISNEPLSELISSLDYSDCIQSSRAEEPECLRGFAGNLEKRSVHDSCICFVGGRLKESSGLSGGWGLETVPVMALKCAFVTVAASSGSSCVTLCFFEVHLRSHNADIWQHLFNVDLKAEIKLWPYEIKLVGYLIASYVRFWFPCVQT